MSHTNHPDVHDHGLADNCPDCQRHAEKLVTLDTSMLVGLHNRLMNGQEGRSGSEQEAMHHLEQAIVLLGRLGYRRSSTKDTSMYTTEDVRRLTHG